MSVTLTRQELRRAIDELPAEVIPKLSSFLEYLRFKTGLSPLDELTRNTPDEAANDSAAFLLSLVGIGTSHEIDLSERDEEILAAEIDPLHGWDLPRERKCHL